MALSDVYKGLEDKYYAFMDSLDAKGIPVYKVIDPIENAGIPSFPVFILLILIILGAIGFFIFGIISGGTETTNISIIVTDSDDTPIDGARVEIIGKETQTTNFEGIVNVSNVKINDSLSVTVTKEGFNELNRTLSVTEKEQVFPLILAAEGENSISVEFRKQGTNELITDSLSVEFSCSDNFTFSATQTITDGVADVAIPNDCGTLYANLTNFSCENRCAVDLESGNLVFYLNEPTAEEIGKINVTIMDEQDNLLAGIEVIARQENDYFDYETCDTTTLGTCSLEGLPFGKYYLVANDQTGKLARFISESLVPPQFVELKQDQPQFDYTITMLESINTKKILLKISNQLGEPVKDAEATLFKELDRIDSKFSGADGIVEFSVTETGTFNVSVEHPSYLKKSVESLTPGQENIISLVPITQENVNRIPVAVVDEKAKPVENARIYLRNSSSLANIGDYIVSGADGKAQFERVEEASYVVFAEKSGFEAKSSGIIIVKNGVPVNEVRIALNIGFGSIKLIVKNEDDSAVSGATIRVIDYCNNSVLEDLAANTSPDGTKTIEVRVDKCVYFEVSATGYLNYSTNIIQPVKGVTIEKSIVLVRSVDSLKSSFVLYSGTNIVSGTSLERGKQYTAKISLLIPEGTSFDEAGVHFRTGAASEATTNAMEKDSIYISSVALGSGKLLKGTSFTPLKGYDTDAKKLTTGNAKWFNASFTKPKAGVYEIIANIQVTQNASSGALLDVYTRAWGRQGTSYSRNPIDGVLGSSESNSQKQVLYANAARNVYTIGNSSLCNEGFCYTFTLTDKSTNLTQGIIDSVPAKIANDYSLNFSLINNSSQTDAAEISVAHNSNGLKLSQYEITDVDSRKLNGTITANKLAVPVGDMLKGATVLGRIDFTTMKEGINNLEFKLNSQTAGGKQTVFSKIFKLEIPPSQSMTLEVLPQVIVPFIENELMIKISNETGSPIEEATVSIKKNNEKIVSGKTNSEGIFSFSLESVREGTIIEISAEKAGYRKQIKTINVQQEIISVNPSSINETIKANIEQTVKRDVQLRNLTDIPLKIGLLDLTTDFDGLVELDFDKDYVGREIVKEVDDNIMLSLKLSPKGKNVTKVTTTNAVLNIHFVSDELQRTWVSSIPIAITIGLGNEADFANCLELDQEAVSIASAGESVQKNILLSNKCTVNGNPIDLKNIEARVKQGAANKIGELVLRSSIEEDTLNLAEESIEFASNITLTEKFKTIASGIGKDKESALTLTFNPDKLDSATSTYTLELRAHNPTAKGDQIILTKTTLNLTVNDLLACVKVIQRAPLQLQLSPFNAGFGQYQNQFGYNPAQGFGAFSSSTDPSYGSLFNNPNVVFPNQGTGNYNNYYQSLQYRNNPSSLFNPQFGATGYTDPRFNNQFSSNIANSEGKFNVENSCTLPMEIRIITDPALVTEPTGMDLTPNQNQDVKVKSTYLIGTYKIEVKAKAKGSSDKQVTVEKLQATIEPNDSYRNWRDCISLDKKVFQFNDFLAKPTEGVITNTCYSSGVILDPSNPIEFDVFNAYTGTPDNVFIDNLVQRTEIVDRTVKPSADGKVIEQVRFRLRKSLEYRTSIPETQRPSETNPLIELYNLRVTFNRGYYTVRAPQSAYINFRTRTGNTQRQIYDVIIEDLWEIPGVLPPITIEDQLGTDSANYDCINAIDWSNDFPNGIPSTRFKNGIFEWTADPSVMIIDRDHCGTADHLKNLQKSLTDSDSGLIISFSLTDNDHNVKLKFDNRNMKQDASIDTSIDADLYRFRLSRSKPATIAVRGTIKSPVIAPQGAKEEARKGIEQGKSAAEICPQLETKYNLTKEQCQKIVDEIIITEFTTCNEAGYKGAADFKTYGFDKLKFAWDFESFEFNSCDAIICTEESCSSKLSSANKTNTISLHGGEAETTTEEHEEGDSHSEEEHELEVREEAENELEGKYFCDAAQYSITLLEKAKKIQEFITANSTTKFQFKEDTTDTKTQKDFEDTDNLWRFVKPQVQIEDKGVAAKPKLVFFLDELTIGDTIIDSRIYSDATKLESNANVKQLITYFNNPPIADKVDTIISTMESILTNISTDASVRNGSDIVAEIDVTDWDSINIKILQDLTGETTLAFGNKYLMTFNEFKALHKAIAAENNCKSPVCSITLYGNVTILLDTDFMQALYKSIEFKIGIRNIDGLSDEEEDDVKDNVPDYEEITWPNDAEDYHEFGENFLEFESLFILDGYSQDFKNDFKTEFGERIYNEVGFGDNWAFDVTGTDKVAKVVQPGKHPVKLNYNWSTESTPKISVTIDVENGRTLNMLDLELATKYKDNYFFYFPIDGKVGSNNNKREGYGISFNSTDKASNIYFNQITVAFNDSANKAIQNFGSSEVDSADGKFAKTRLGIVLDAETNNKFHYYPSIPVAILTKITGSNGTDGLFYSLHSGNDVGEKEKLSYVLEWKQSCTQSPIKDKKQSINAFCSGNSSEYYGLTPDIQERTTKGYGTIAYLPHTQQIYTLDLICSKEKTKTTILPFKEGFSAKTLDQSRTTGSLDIKSFTVLKDIAENAGERHIDQFINSIKKDEMCFKPGDNGRSIVIKWNENKIFEPLKNECSAVTTSD